MTDFQEGHPCKGKDCKDCETCIFDRDLFEDGVTPNEREKNKKTDSMCNRTCNECVNLVRSYEYCQSGRFDAACKVVSYTAFNQSRPRRIDYNLSPNQSIASPNWCPLLANNSKPPMALPSQSRPTTPMGADIVTPPTSTPIYTKREKMKELQKHIEWKDIEEGKVYLIPKILTQARKIVKVITKTDMCCTCHEISEYTGNEYTYNCSFYPSDLDAVFITEIHEF